MKDNYPFSISSLIAQIINSFNLNLFTKHLCTSTVHKYLEYYYSIIKLNMFILDAEKLI